MQNYLKAITRIRSNVQEALGHAISCKILSCEHPVAEGHFLLIEQIFQRQLHVLQYGDFLVHSCLPSEQFTYVSIWFDIQFWITKLGCFYERIILMIKKSERMVDLVGDEFSARANSIIGQSLILARFIEASTQTAPPLLWIRDEQLMRTLVDAAKSVYIRIFSTLEEIIVSIYNELIDQDKIPRAETELSELLKLCEQIPFSTLEKDPNLIRVASQLEKIKKKAGKMAAKEYPQFARIIKHVTEIFLLETDRKIDLKHWIFFLHARNSLLHKKGWGITDYEIELWGRSYKIVKDNPFELYIDSSYLILAFRLIEVFVELVLKISEENYLFDEWLGIKRVFLNIKVPQS